MTTCLKKLERAPKKRGKASWNVIIKITLHENESDPSLALQPPYLKFLTLGYSLYMRAWCMCSSLVWLLDTPLVQFVSRPNKKTQWRFHWKWHLLLKSAGEHWNINFIKNVYSGLCTWSILILWHITHSTLVSGNGAVVSLEAVIDSSFCLNRSLHFMSTQIEQYHPLEGYVNTTFRTMSLFV